MWTYATFQWADYTQHFSIRRSFNLDYEAATAAQPDLENVKLA